MRRSADGALWAVLLAGAGTFPLASALAAAGIVVVSARSVSGAALPRLAQRLTSVWPAPLLAAVLGLALGQSLRGAPWTDLLGLVVWGAVLALALPSARDADAPRRARILDGILVGSLGAVALHAVAATPDLAGWAVGEPARVTGLAGHPNVLAPSLLLVAATLAVVAWATAKTRRRAALIGIAPALLLVLASGSRAAVLGALVGVAFWAALALARSRTAAAGATTARSLAALTIVALAVLVPLVLASVRGLPVERLLAGDVERATVFSVALDVVATRPVLGHGGAAWAQLVAQAEPAVPWALFSHPHAVLLHVLVHGGAVGLALAGLLLAFGWRALAPRWRDAMAARGLVAPLLAAVAGALVLQAFVDVVVINPAVYLATAGVLAALVCTPRRYHPAR